MPKQPNNQPKLPTVKQQRYIDCFNGDIKSSAEAAGVSYQYAKELHTKTYYSHILRAIQRREGKNRKKGIADREERQRFWSSILRTELTRLQTLPTGSKVEVTPDFKEMLKASELLGRSEADFTDKLIIGIDEKMLQVILSAIPNKDWANAVREALLIYAKSMVK